MQSPPRPGPDEAPTDLVRLTRLVAILRSENGCPWDREQDFESVRAYLLEEAHEAISALDRNASADLVEELGDLLFQIAFIAELLAEQGSGTIAQILDQIEHKMVVRHPHVFELPAEEGSRDPPEKDTEQPLDAEDVARRWVSAKRSRALEQGNDPSVLAGIPPSLPPLTRALRMTQKAAGLGFDWPDWQGVASKLDEEVSELPRRREFEGHGRDP